MQCMAQGLPQLLSSSASHTVHESAGLPVKKAGVRASSRGCHLLVVGPAHDSEDPGESVVTAMQSLLHIPPVTMNKLCSKNSSGAQLAREKPEKEL